MSDQICKISEIVNEVEPGTLSKPGTGAEIDMGAGVGAGAGVGLAADCSVWPDSVAVCAGCSVAGRPAHSFNKGISILPLELKGSSSKAVMDEGNI
ncbi:MAG TPA: hypothetical protein GX726_00115 [Clostridiales bacterium]|nr:hypothetical protein [Clostridiales bacterium]